MRNFDMDFVEHVKNAISLSNLEKSKLNNEILNLNGMSSYKVKHLLNNLCNFKGCKYFEVGTWAGSTLVAALFENELTAYACDNWTEFGNPKESFFSNIGTYINKKKIELCFFDKNCFKLTKEDIKDKINVYFFDGAHSYESHYNSLIYFEDFFDDEIVVVIDDYGDDPPKLDYMFKKPHGVRIGTEDALEDLKKFKVKFSQELPPFVKHGGGEIDKDYWCGLRVLILEKK